MYSLPNAAAYSFSGGPQNVKIRQYV